MSKCTTLFMGGLGNMMFQAASSYAYSQKHNMHHVLLKHHQGTLHNPPEYYFNNIFRNFEKSEERNWTVLTESEQARPCVYKELPYSSQNNDNIALKGFFQSEKYFINVQQQIKKLFSPSSTDLDYILNKYRFFNTNTCISIHIRKGDYVKLQQYHHNLDLGYYVNAIDYFQTTPNVKFLIFSDDLNWCKEVFGESEEFEYINEADYISLYMMSLCNHNIIANSTFSWWGAYLNNHPDRIIIHPDKWFGTKNQDIVLDDLYPKSWISMTEEYPKVMVNLMGGICRHLTKSNARWSTVHNKISSYVKLLRDTPYLGDIVVYSDDTIQTNLPTTLDAKHKLGWLMETREINSNRYDNFEKYKDNFEFVMTHDKQLLEKYPDKTRFVPFGGCWIKDYNFKIFPKTKNVSMVYSNKMFMPGHKLRHEIVKNTSNIDLYGNGSSNAVEYKEQALIEYRFSIVVENSKTENYFTEKLIDCLAVGTVPIYWGCTNIDKFFNTDSILTFNTLEELQRILNSISEDKYKLMLPGIKENLELAKEYNIVEDWIYKNIFKELNEKK